MKKYLAWFLVVLFIFVAQEAKAHSVLESSSPAAGEVVTNPLTEIVLDFNTKVEKGSRFTFSKTTSEEVVKPRKLANEKKRLVGSLEKPLSDGYYTIKWEIVGADGHFVTGNVPFQVKSDIIKSEKTISGKNSGAKVSSEINQSSNETSKIVLNSPVIVSLIMLFIVLAVVIMIMLGKKKR